MRLEQDRGGIHDMERKCTAFQVAHFNAIVYWQVKVCTRCVFQCTIAASML